MNKGYHSIVLDFIYSDHLLSRTGNSARIILDNLLDSDFTAVNLQVTTCQPLDPC